MNVAVVLDGLDDLRMSWQQAAIDDKHGRRRRSIGRLGDDSLSTGFASSKTPTVKWTGNRNAA